MSDVQVFPAWRQAVQEFMDAGFAPGAMIPHEWLESRFGMPSLAESQRLTAEQFRARQFEWLANIQAFRDCLLKDHQICLESVHGKGYRWVPPGEQTDYAVREFERNARKVFRQTGDRLRNLRHLELTDEQRRKNVDVTAKLSALSGMARKVLAE